MDFVGGSFGDQREDVLRQEAAAKQQRLQAKAEARKRARESRPSRLRRLFRRGK
jgi:hypothetical protein